MKKILIILASIIVVVGLGVGVYFYFFAPGSATITVGGNPFDGTGSGVVPASDTPLTDENGVSSGAGTEVAPRLVKITNGPVALGVSSSLKISTTTNGTSSPPTVEKDVEVHFIERTSGNIYSYLARARSLTRISNKTLPGIQKASWAPSGSTAFVQFLSKDQGSEQVATYSLSSTGGNGFFLEPNLEQATVVDSSTLLTLLSGTSGSVATVSKIDGSGAKSLFTSNLSSLRVLPSLSSYFAVSKASASLDGYGFSVKSGGFTRILGPLRGLSILPSPSGKSVLYSYTDAGTYHLSVLDVANHTAIALPVATLVEKCVWSADSLSVYCGVPTTLAGRLPDTWYQGATSFSDRLWKIDMTARIASLVVDPQEVGKVSLDMISLSTDTSQDFLVFTDKTTNSLWAYDL